MSKIVIVDDDADILEIVNLILSNRGYTVYTLANSHEIVSTIKKLKPDLLLLDVYHHEFLAPNDLK